MEHESKPIVVVGAGPAGLTAAYELTRHGLTPVVLEKGDKVGGIARTETYKGYRFDIGGHRFYTKVDEVQKLWDDVLRDSFIQVPRLSRIYYRGNYFNYPLNFLNVLGNLGIIESFMILLSYLKVQLRPRGEEETTFEDWVVNRFGRRLYNIFFKTYTEKVWGVPGSKIHAHWAAQRIKGLSLTAAVWNAFFKTRDIKSLIEEFHYPRLGPGQMWECFSDAIEKRGGTVHLNTDVVKLNREGNRIRSIVVKNATDTVEIEGRHFISSMPINELILQLDPPPPPDVLHAAHKLQYRAFIIVAIVIDADDLFPDNWIYIHSPEVTVGRIQNFKNWSKEMVPDEGKTCLGMEYFCAEGDDIWTMADADLVKLATVEVEKIGLAKASQVKDGCVIRQPKAYPVYDHVYMDHVTTIKDYLATIENLQTIGRNGMHRYNNQDHSMLTALLAVKNFLGEDHDLWNVNTERSYYEEFQTK